MQRQFSAQAAVCYGRRVRPVLLLLPSLVRVNVRAALRMSLASSRLVPTLKCSATSHDSKAEKSSEVATPQKMRPTKRMLKLLKCFVQQPNT